jgi:hypothetical protein
LDLWADCSLVEQAIDLLLDLFSIFSRLCCPGMKKTSRFSTATFLFGLLRFYSLLTLFSWSLGALGLFFLLLFHPSSSFFIGNVLRSLALFVKIAIFQPSCSDLCFACLHSVLAV